MYDGFVHDVYSFLRQENTVSTQIIKSEYNYINSKGLQELSALIREEIETDRVNDRNPIEFMYKLSNSFQCKKVVNKSDLVNILCQYSMLADKYDHEIKKNESVFITTCAKNGDTFAYLFMGIEQAHIWDIVPTIELDSTLTIQKAREYYREILYIAGVTPKEYQHLEVILTRYFLIAPLEFDSH